MAKKASTTTNANPANTAPPVENNPISEGNGAPKQESKKIEVDATILQDLLNKVSELEEKTKQYEQTATQDQIRKLDALRASGKLVKSVKVRRLNGKLVLGWRNSRDEVWVADEKLHENQYVEVFFEDGEKEEMPLLQFTRQCTYEKYEVLKESKTAEGVLEYTVELPGGKELIVKETFIN